MSLAYFLQYGECTVYTVAEDSKLNKSRHKQNMRGTICTRNRIEPVAILSNFFLRNFFSERSVFGFSPKEVISQTSTFPQSVAF